MIHKDTCTKKLPHQKKKFRISWKHGWMNLEDTVLNKMSQAQKDKHYMISHICSVKSPHSWKQREWWLSEDGKRENRYMLVKRYRASGMHNDFRRRKVQQYDKIINNTVLPS